MFLIMQVALMAGLNLTGHAITSMTHQPLSGTTLGRLARIWEVTSNNQIRRRKRIHFRPDKEAGIIHLLGCVAWVVQKGRLKVLLDWRHSTGRRLWSVGTIDKRTEQFIGWRELCKHVWENLWRWKVGWHALRCHCQNELDVSPSYRLQEALLKRSFVRNRKDVNQARL